MSDSESFEIDFSEANPIADINSRHNLKSTNRAELENLWGFFVPVNADRASGPCAIGTILHHHDIGWNHIPRDRQGHPLNDPFINEIMRWSETPNLLSGSLGTSPMKILKALRNGGLQANWYAGNNTEITLDLICSELAQSRPVIVLINHGPVGNPLLLEWEVVFKVSNEQVYSKRSTGQSIDQSRSIAQFKEQITLELAQLSCSVITALKD